MDVMMEEVMVEVMERVMDVMMDDGIMVVIIVDGIM